MSPHFLIIEPNRTWNLVTRSHILEKSLASLLSEGKYETQGQGLEREGNPSWELIRLSMEPAEAMNIEEPSFTLVSGIT